MSYIENILPDCEHVQILRRDVIDQLPPPIADVEAWCDEVIQREAIAAIANANMELFKSFAATLGEVALIRKGIDITNQGIEGRE